MRQVKKAFPKAKFVAYIPETKRYGGSAGVLIAEKLFEASSTAVLQLLANQGSWTYRRALVSALQMHIGMLAVSGTEAVALCKHLAENTHRIIR